MRIALDCSFLVLNRASGMHTYTYNLLKALLARNRSDDYVGAFFYFRGQARVPKIEGMRPAIVRFPRRILEWAWTHLKFPPVDWMIGGVDIYHSVHCLVPPIGRGASILTLHDMREYALPGLYPGKSEFRLQRAAWARQADRLIAISESTRRDAIEFLGVDPQRVQVVHNGVDFEFWSSAGSAERAAVRSKFQLERPYLLFLASADPRKGLACALKAFAAIRGRIDHDLVVVGELPRNATGLNAPGVRVLGVLPQLTVRALMSEAEALLFPSFYEGFGLPVLEAFACSTPVVAYSSSSIPEVAGDAASLVPVGQWEALGEAVLSVLTDQTRTREMVGRGLQRCQQFTWERAAEQVEAIYLGARG